MSEIVDMQWKFVYFIDGSLSTNRDCREIDLRYRQTRSVESGQDLIILPGYVSLQQVNRCVRQCQQWVLWILPMSLLV